MTITRRKLMIGTMAVSAVALPTAVLAADPEEDQMLAVFRKLPDDQRALFHSFMRTMARLPRDLELDRRWKATLGYPNGRLGT